MFERADVKHCELSRFQARYTPKAPELVRERLAILGSVDQLQPQEVWVFWYTGITDKMHTVKMVAATQTYRRGGVGPALVS